jgi:hypothetical protein
MLLCVLICLNLKLSHRSHPPTPTTTLITKDQEEILSKYDQFATVMKDEGLLIESLQALGHKVEIFKEGMTIRGAYGDLVPEPVHIVIRGSTLAGDRISDIGFSRLPDGSYRAHLNDWDQRRGYDRQWLGRVQQAYKERHTIQMAHQRGYVFRGREVIQTEHGEQVKLLFGRR